MLINGMVPLVSHHVQLKLQYFDDISNVNIIQEYMHVVLDNGVLRSPSTLYAYQGFLEIEIDEILA